MIAKKQEEENERIKADRAELEAAKAKHVEAERQIEEKQAEIESERQALKAAQAKIEAAERQKQAAIEKENRRLAEAKAEEERKAEMLRVADERKPDGEKLAALADTIETIVLPSVTTEWAAQILCGVAEDINEITVALRGRIDSEA